MAKKEGKLILPPAPTENKKRKRSDAPKEPKAKKAKPDKKETKSIPVKTPKKNKKQPTLFDHFQKGVTSKPKNGESSPEYAPKLLDLVDLAKSLEAERNSRFSMPRRSFPFMNILVMSIGKQRVK